MTDKTAHVSSPWGWGVDLTPEQHCIGSDLATKGASRFAIFEALKAAGVPVREKDRYPASEAATAFSEQRTTELLELRGITRAQWNRSYFEKVMQQK